MPSGFETFVEGTADIQLKDSTIYFSLVKKGILPQPTQWFNVRGSSVDPGYWWGEVFIPYSSLNDEHLVLVVAPSQLPCSIFYTLRAKTTTGLRFILSCSVNNIPINYWIFSTKSPPLNASRMGLELYKEGALVFASETPTLRPLMHNANNGYGINTSGSKKIGVVCNKQGYTYEYAWSNDGPGEFWYAESESITAVRFNSQYQAQPDSFSRNATGFLPSGEPGYGERYRENAGQSYTFIDITGI